MEKTSKKYPEKILPKKTFYRYFQMEATNINYEMLDISNVHLKLWTFFWHIFFYFYKKSWAGFFCLIKMEKNVRKIIQIFFKKSRFFSRYFQMDIAIIFLILNKQKPSIGSHFSCFGFHFLFLSFARGNSLLESWGTTFLPNRQPPLIFVWFTSKSHEH